MVAYEDEPLVIETVNITNDSDVKKLYSFAFRPPGLFIMPIFHPAIIEKFQNLEVVSMAGGIEKITSKTFENCGNLIEIDFGHNSIKSIDSGVFINCQNLKILRLNDNFVMTIDIDGFEGLTNLEELYLSYTNLSSFTHEIFKHTQSLKILDLSNTRIWRFDPATTFPQSLVKLHLVNLHVAEITSEIFKNLTNLEVLDFTGNVRLNYSLDLPNKLFEPLKSLKELHLNSTFIRRLNSNYFGRHESLTHLFIVYSSIREIEPNFFDNFPNLEVIDMRGETNCFDGIIDNASSIDFKDEIRFERCFNRWLGIDETTTTWRPPNNNGGLEWWIYTLIGLGIFLISRIAWYVWGRLKKSEIKIENK
jgi:Leucine-rich repeat (LRR) protein